jgi:hypothetical protein
VKLKLATAAVILSSTVSAQDYQLFSNLAWTHTNIDGATANSILLGGQYFFDKKTALGPYSEFEYINKTSNVFANYLNVETGESYGLNLGGEAFVNNVLLGATLSESKGDNSANTLSFGYLFSDDFLVRVDRYDGDNMDASYMISAAYNHQLNDTDYVGFTFGTDDEVEVISLSSRYFTHLGEDRYFVLEAGYQDNDFDNSWDLAAKYYFSKATGVFANFDSEDSVGIGLEHFFNSNIAGQVAFLQSEVGTEDADTIYLGVKGQF